jgi:hypothetical protein
VDLLLGLVDDEGLEHRDPVEERLEVAEDDAGLLSVRGEHHHDPALTGGQDRAVVPERRDEDGDQRRDSGLPPLVDRR